MGWQHFFKHLIGFKIAYFSFDHHVTLTFGTAKLVAAGPPDAPRQLGVPPGRAFGAKRWPGDHPPRDDVANEGGI